MLLSNVTVDTVLDYIKAEDNAETRGEAAAFLAAAKAFITSSTGLTLEECDNHEDITIAVLCLCGDMHDNRQMTVEIGHENRTVETILEMHQRNF